MNGEFTEYEKINNSLEDIKKRHPIINLAINNAIETYSQDREITYHNEQHLLDVQKTALELGLKEGLDQPQIDLLIIASSYHDYFQGKDHEARSSVQAKIDMSNAGNYSEKDIEVVQNAINSTKINYSSKEHQKAENIISKILQDADVANFGRGDFFANTLSLYKELNNIELDLNSENGRRFIKNTLNLLKKHKWKTKSAEEKFNKMKEENIKILEEALRN